MLYFILYKIQCYIVVYIKYTVATMLMSTVNQIHRISSNSTVFFNDWPTIIHRSHIII